MAGSGVLVRQINLHHSKCASAILVRSVAMLQTSISLIQEPWLLKGAIKGLSGCGKICYTHSNRKNRTCIAVKGLNATFMPQLSCEDLTVVQVKLNLSTEESLDVLVGSAYMPYDSVDPPPQGEIKNLIAYAEERGLELLLGCDANSHHVGWGSSDINPRGESLHDFIMSTNLIILNRGTEFTFQDSRRQEVIDITLCTRRVAGLVSDWRVSNEPSGSDHRQICLSLRHIPVDKWMRNPRRTDWEGYKAALSANLGSVPKKFYNKNDLNAAALFMKGVITDSYEANCPLKRRLTSSKVPWWNKELSKLRSRTRKLFNKARKSGSATCWAGFRTTQREYSRAITSAKRRCWRSFCESIESLPEASRLNKILNSGSCLQMGCLKHPDGHYTGNLTESFTLLMETHFPGFQPLTSKHPLPAVPRPRAGYVPKEWALAARVVHPEGVKWAVRSFDPYKAPGPDGIYPCLLQQGLDLLIGPLTKILRASIALRHVPPVWSDIKVCFIPKPGKNGHILAKDYRPISLTSFVLKTLEKLVEGFIKSGPLVYKPLSSCQYAYREGRSTDTALHHLVGSIESQLTAKGYVLGVFLDIEGAFDSTSYPVIEKAMADHDIPVAIIDWTLSMLTGRTLTVNQEDLTLKGFPTKGCPQGGVLSPLLWCLVVDELLINLQKTNLRVFGYADDVAIILRGGFLSILKELMDKALRSVQNWCVAKRLTVNPNKTEAMIFTRKYKPEHIDPLKLWNTDIQYASSIKYLGVYLDPKLNWSQHLEIKRKKFYISFWACRRAMGATWGVKPRVALWLYKAILLPRLLYAAVVWWPRVEKVGARNLLKSLQGSYLRAAVGTMRTTPTEALETALCIPPLGQRIICAAKLTAYRLYCQKEWKCAGPGHTRLDFLFRPPFSLKQDKITRKHHPRRIFKISIPDRAEWENNLILNRLGPDVWYTDGSGSNDRFGAGIYAPKNDFSLSIPMGGMATVFQAEVLAILECAKSITTTRASNRGITICTDSQAALGALAKPTTESSLVWDCMQALDHLGEHNRVTLMWVPGHRGVQGNEVADGLAKAGTLEDPAELMVGVPYALGRSIIIKQLDQRHHSLWVEGRGCRQARMMMHQPSKKRADELLTLSRGRLRLALGLLTGHVALRAHLFTLGLATQSTCRLCGEDKEDAIHILCHCPALAFKRFRYLGSIFLEPNDLQNNKVNNLCNLAINAGLGLQG